MAEKTMESVQTLWGEAKKVRSRLFKEIEHAEDPSVDERALVRLFETTEQTLLPDFRQLCVSIVWADITYGSENKVEENLWLAHVKVARAYKKITDSLSGSQHAVMRNRIHKHHQHFLKISQDFYRGYLMRTAARYHTLPQLKRALRGANIPGFDVPEEDHVDAAAAKIDKLVTASAYRTLVCLGDLARYRVLLRPERERKFDTAMTYYSLACDVDSRFGTAYHQMAVIFREEEKYMDAVYYLYRSLVSKSPYPQATQNLTVVLSNLVKNKATGSVKQMAHGALQTWFPRLHAHFYTGKVFSQHNELEKEVLGRFDKAVKAYDFEEGLLKVLLINICAYEVASSKVEDKWTEEASRTCQFVLRLHIQMITSISAHVDSELSKLIDTLRDASSHTDGTNGNGIANKAIKFSPVTEAALPLLRVCLTWLCMYRTRIVDYQPYLLPHIPDMYRVLSRTLTRFIELLGLFQEQQIDQFKPVNYLFQEDIMTLGIQSLHGPDLPTKCQLSVDSMTGQPKPRSDEESGLVLKSDDITYSRALDIIYRAYILTKDPRFPFALHSSGSAVVYLEDGKPTQTVDGSSGYAGQQETVVNTPPVANTPPKTTEVPAAANKPEVTHQRQDSSSAAALIASLGLTRSTDGLQVISKEGAPQQAPPAQRSTPKLQSARATPQQSPREDERKAVTSPAPAGRAPTGRFVRQSVQLGSGPIKPIRQPHNPPTGQLKVKSENFKTRPNRPSSTEAAAAAKVPSLVPAESFNSADEHRVFDMVKDFLEPREGQQQQQMSDEPSYGMHSNTARELFGSDLISTPAAAPVAPPPATNIQEQPITAQWDAKPTPAAGNGWGSSNLWTNNGPKNTNGGGMQLNGTQSGWPNTTGFTDRPMTSNSGLTNGQYGHSANNSGSFPSPAHNLAPGTHWRQDSRGSGLPPPGAQPDPWRQQTASQPRQSAPGLGAPKVGPIRSLDDALAAQLAALIPNRSSYSPANQASTPQAGQYNHLPVPGSFGSSQFAFSQESGRPQVNNSPWNVGNNNLPTAGYAYPPQSSGASIQPPPGFGRPAGNAQLPPPGSGRPQSQDNSQDNSYGYNQYYNQYR